MKPSRADLGEGKMMKGGKILIFAGPNGAGKTTFATEFLADQSESLAFVNADLIAAGLSPFKQASANFRAGRMLLDTIREHVANGESFAFETTLSGSGYARSIPRWRERGFVVELFYLRLPNPDLAVDRVRLRVSEGGHDVPEAVIRRRFHASWRNFENIYRSLVDEWKIFDNSSPKPILLETGGKR